jgi:hypothetical protein
MAGGKKQIGVFYLAIACEVRVLKSDGRNPMFGLDYVYMVFLWSNTMTLTFDHEKR